jgi:putative transposase
MDAAKIVGPSIAIVEPGGVRWSGGFGLLKRERVNRRKYQSRAEARTDVFDYIERFHNPRRARKTEQRTNENAGLIQPSVEKG